MPGPSGAARIFDRFLNVCRERPDRRALVHGGRSWTYSELERGSRALAAKLRASASPNEVVALYARRSPELVVGMLGALRAGLTFAVLDAAYPAERLKQLAAIARPGRLVTAALTTEDEVLLGGLGLPEPTERLDGHTLKVLARGEGHAASPWEGRAVAKSPAKGAEGSEVEPKGAPGAGATGGEGRFRDSVGVDQVAPAAMAYLLFTSGTTGTPKCIKTAHHPLVHFIDWYAPTFGAGPESRFSLCSGLGHDPVLRDVFVPLSVGAELHVPEQATLLDPPKFHAWLAHAQITHAHVTPQLSRIFCAGAAGQKPLQHLKYVFSGGDVLRRKVAAEIAEVAPQARVVNFYGASETPQAMGYHVFDPATDGDLDVVPIGRGISDVQLLVLEDVGAGLRLAEVGARGQIATRTKFLSAGYLDDAGLTNKKFVPHPDGRDSEDLFYLTGDVGHFRPDGSVVAEGRLDDQVKVRGFRVELGEVMHGLERLASVASAVVLAEEAPDGENRLAAFLIAKPGLAPDAQAVKAQLAAALPPYMVPFRFVWLPAFPLLPNGKVDRAQLRALKPATAEEENAATDDPTEAAIVAQWKGLLGVDAIRVDRSFVDLGGDSLSFIRAAMQLQGLLGVLPDRWDRLSIRELARCRTDRRSFLTHIDSSVLMRAISIVAIVAAHFGLPNLAGSARTLFVVSGMSLGKYLVTSVLRTSSVSAILRLAFRIALPTALYTVLLDVVFFKHFQWQAVFLLNNFVRPHYDQGGFSFWFIDVLVQSQLIFAALLAIAPLRELVRRRQFEVAFALTLVMAAVAYVVPKFWDTSALYDHVPHLYFGPMCLGWAAIAADTPRRKLLVLAATVATFADAAGLAWHEDELLWLPFLGTAFLVYVPQISLPVLAARAINLVAGASLFIYLADLQVRSVLFKTALAKHPSVVLVVAVIVGIAMWKGWETGRDFVGRLFAGGRGASSRPAEQLA